MSRCGRNSPVEPRQLRLRRIRKKPSEKRGWSCTTIAIRARFGGLRSPDNAFHHFPKHIRQPEIPALMTIGQALMLQPEKVQNRGVEIMRMHGLIDRPKA